MESRQTELGLSHVREQLLEVWRFVLQRRDVEVDDEWTAVGGSSLDALDVAYRVEEIFGGKFPLSLFAEEPTVQRQAEWLLSRVEGKPWNPIVRLRQGTGKRPFFCVHPIDGNVLCYTEIAAAMKEGPPFYGIQAKGLDGVEQPNRTFPEMAAHYVDAIRGVQRKGPYHLGGWSVGGTIAFLVAQQLRAQGEEVALLAMIDALYPERSGSAGRDPSPEEWQEFEQLILDSPEPVPDEYVEGRTLHELNLEQWVQFRPQPYDGKITMIVADRQLGRIADALADLRREMKKGPFGKARRALRTAERLERMSPLRWREVAGGGFEMIPLAGSHRSVVQGESAAKIAQMLGERMR